MNAVEPTEEALTCEFGRYDDAGEPIFECARTDYEEVVMGDEGIVRLCPKHRSWAPSLAPAPHPTPAPERDYYCVHGMADLKGVCPNVLGQPHVGAPITVVEMSPDPTPAPKADERHWEPGYRPSNGTEGDIFRAQWCGNCTVDHEGGWHDPDPDRQDGGSCPILMDALDGEHSYPNPDGPPQWEVMWLDRGYETRCTEFRGPCSCPHARDPFTGRYAHD